jgi:hypothetical protein
MIDNVRSNNKTIMEEHDRAHVELRPWQRFNAHLDMAFPQSLPADIWQAMDNHDTAANKWQDILARFEEGLFPTLSRPISRRSRTQTSLPGPIARPPMPPLSPCQSSRRNSRNSNRIVPLLVGAPL